MCNIEQWTFIDSNGNRHPRERLYPCARTTAAHTPCSDVRVYTLNDEVQSPALVTIQAVLKKKLKKADTRDDLRLEWDFKMPWSKPKVKKKTPAPPIPKPPTYIRDHGHVVFKGAVKTTSVCSGGLSPSVPFLFPSSFEHWTKPR